MSSQVPLEQLIYLCLPEKKGYLETVPAKKVGYYDKNFSSPKNRESAIEALKYRDKFTWLGYNQLNIVCIPAHQIVLWELFDEGTGYIKVQYKTQRECYLSGKRSAIFFDKGRILRLKGCGNMFEGFVYVEESGLRGSHFFHTAKREMHMNQLIDTRLRNHGRKAANKSDSMFEYSPDFNMNLNPESGIRDQLPLVSKYCCVFETIGQRRLGTHLISSLELLFCTLIKNSSQELEDLMKNHNRWDADGPIPTPTEWEFTPINKPEDIFIQLLKNKIANKAQPLNLLHQTVLELIGQPTDTTGMEGLNSIHKLKADLNIEKTASQQILKILEKKLEHLTTTQNILRLIALVTWKLGWEVGDVKRILCEQKINWGFFEDHNVTHCNAHLNNFVIKRITTGSEIITYPLDFDLAFTKEEFIDIDRESPLYGRNNPVKFEELAEGEYKALQISLSGIEVMNFKYGILDKSLLKGEDLLKDTMSRTLFRDVLMQGFMEGMAKSTFSHEQDYRQSWEPVRELIDVCLILSQQFET